MFLWCHLYLCHEQLRSSRLIVPTELCHLATADFESDVVCEEVGHVCGAAGRLVQPGSSPCQLIIVPRVGVVEHVSSGDGIGVGASVYVCKGKKLRREGEAEQVGGLTGRLECGISLRRHDSWQNSDLTSGATEIRHDRNQIPKPAIIHQSPPPPSVHNCQV